MPISSHKNFAISTLATPPSSTDGTSLVVASGHGALFPEAPFNVTVWPTAVQPTSSNAEIMRVTAKATDTFTVTRAQEGTSGRTHLANAQIAATITARTLTDVEYGAHGIINVMDPAYGAVGDGVTDDTAAIQAAVTAMTAGDRLVFPAGHTFLISTNITKSSVDDLSVVAYGATIYTTDMSLTGVFTFTSCDRLTWEGGYFLGTEDNTYFQANTPSEERSFLYLNACERATVRSIRGKHKRRLMTALDSHYLTVDDYKMEGFFADISGGQVANFLHAPAVTIRGCDFTNISRGMANNCGMILLGQLTSEHVTVEAMTGHDLHDEAVYVSSGRYWTISNVAVRACCGNVVQTRGSNMCVSNIAGEGLTLDYVVSMTGLGVSADATGADADGYNLVASNITANDCLGAFVANPNNGYYPRDIIVRGVAAYDSTGTGDTASVIEVLAHSGVDISHVSIRTAACDMGMLVQGAAIGTPVDGVSIKDVSVRDINGSSASTRGGIRVTYAQDVTVSGCTFQDIASGIGVRLLGVVDGIVSNNQYDGGQVVAIPTGESNTDIMVHGNRGATFNLDTAGVRAQNNVGYINASGGVTSAIATGATVTHGMVTTPTIVTVTALDSGPTDVYVASIGATTFTINYGGGGTHVFAWEAKTSTYYA